MRRRAPRLLLLRPRLAPRAAPTPTPRAPVKLSHTGKSTVLARLFASPPRGVRGVPFSLRRDDAIALAGKFRDSNLWRPFDLSALDSVLPSTLSTAVSLGVNVRRIFLPVLAARCTAELHFEAQVGHEVTHYRPSSSGSFKSETRTEWTAVSDSELPRRTIDGISGGHPAGLVYADFEFAEENLGCVLAHQRHRDFRREAVDWQEAWQRSQGIQSRSRNEPPIEVHDFQLSRAGAEFDLELKVTEALKRNAVQTLKARYNANEARLLRWSVSISVMEWMPVYVPVFALSRRGGEGGSVPLRVFVDGVDGRVSGEVAYSMTKYAIVGGLAAPVAVQATLLYATEGTFALPFGPWVWAVAALGMLGGAYAGAERPRNERARLDYARDRRRSSFEKFPRGLGDFHWSRFDEDFGGSRGRASGRTNNSRDRSSHSSTESKKTTRNSSRQGGGGIHDVRARDPLRVLGLSLGATMMDVRREFSRLAKELHPDTHPKGPQHEEANRRKTDKFREVVQAYTTLRELNR